LSVIHAAPETHLACCRYDRMEATIREGAVA
jgi:hypothetical protein